MSTIDELKALSSLSLGFARSNRFLVEMPAIEGASGLFGGAGRELNLLCNRASLPGKQILTADKRIGMWFEKVAYGYAVADVELSFYALNNYFVKKYFDAWLALVLNEETGEVGYKNDYAQTVKIHQLRSPQLGLSTDIGPISLSAGIGGGSVYSIELLEAFPTTVNSIDFTNDQDGLIQVSVSLSYTNWKVIEPSQNFLNLSIGF